MIKDKRLFSKEEIKGLVESCQRTVTSFISSDATISVRYNRMERIVHTVMSIECAFAYMYAEIYKYGKITEIINPDSDAYARYTLAASLVFSESSAMEKFLGKMPLAWNKIAAFARDVGLSGSKKEQTVDNDLDKISRAIQIICCHYLSGKNNS